MKNHRVLASAGISVVGAGILSGAEDLRLNPRLDYSSDSQDGPLITGKHLRDGTAKGKPNYIIFYGEG